METSERAPEQAPEAQPAPVEPTTIDTGENESGQVTESTPETQTENA